MSNSPLYYDVPQQVIPLTPPAFTNANGVAVDPDVVQLVVTDPNNTVTTYTYSAGSSDPTPNVIIKSSTGSYHMLLKPFTGPTPPPPGLWHSVWIGISTGTSTIANGSQVFTHTDRVLPSSGMAGLNLYYCGLDELKSRLQIDPTDIKDDYEAQLAIQTVTSWITAYCGQFFYQVTETRTYRPANVWWLDIDPVVSISSVHLDYDGDGVYEVSWTQDVDYQLMRYPNLYNARDRGVDRPKNRIQVLLSAPNHNPAGGGWLPFLWPFTKQDRVQISGTWGWPAVPPDVSQAALILAADLFRAKDAPFGVMGMGGLGLVKVQSNPWVVELLRDYIWMPKKVGV